jgi:glutamine amidotransferase
VKDIVIVDYGMGNIKSVQRGLEQVGAKVMLTSDPEVIAIAGRLVLPGVGAFEDGMKGIEKAELNTAIFDFVKTGNPLLGICLGMQMLLDQSEENGKHQGLGLIPGYVKAIPTSKENQFNRKIPHIGWNDLKLPKNQHDWFGTSLADTKIGEYFYFVHSFMAVLEDSMNLIAQCDYEGLLVAAAIRQNNVTGLQFHPEKSGESGLKILHRFVNL